MPEQKILFYKITGYIVISNPSFDAGQKMKNRCKPGPLLKIYNQPKTAAMNDVSPMDETSVTWTVRNRSATPFYPEAGREELKPASQNRCMQGRPVQVQR